MKNDFSNTPRMVGNLQWFELAFKQPNTWDLLQGFIKEIGYDPATIQSHGVPIGADDEGELNKDIRSTNVGWLRKTVETEPIFNALREYVLVANQEWDFALTDFEGALQIGVYDEEGFYDWHMDTGIGYLSRRKITIIVPLNEGYEGGEVEVLTSEGTFTLSRSANSINLFPSYLMHRVKPVTKGSRMSLVAWVNGPAFR